MLATRLDFCYVRGVMLKYQQFMDEKDADEFLWIDTESTLSQMCYQNDNHGNEYDLISKGTYENVLEKVLNNDTENKLVCIRYGE